MENRIEQAVQKANNYLVEHISKFDDLDSFLDSAYIEVNYYYDIQNDFWDIACFRCYLKAYLMMYVSQFSDDDFRTLVENSVHCVEDDIKQKVVDSTKHLSEDDFQDLLGYIEDTYDRLIYWGENINRAELRREVSKDLDIDQKVRRIIIDTNQKLINAFLPVTVH